MINQKKMTGIGLRKSGSTALETKGADSGSSERLVLLSLVDLGRIIMVRGHLRDRDLSKKLFYFTFFPILLHSLFVLNQ